MIRSARVGFYTWLVFSGIIVSGLVWTYSRHGSSGFDYFIQESPYTLLSVTFTAVSLCWLLAGFLLWQLSSNRINKENIWTWAGFYSAAFLYLNVLRERFRYGDISYYTEAAQRLAQDLPLPDTYLYPPLWANLLEFLVPFGEETMLWAAWLLNVVSLLVFYFLLLKILERYHFSQKLAALVTTAFLLVNMPMLRNLFYVQVNLHLLNLILLGMLWFHNRPYLSALALAAAIHLKASPAVLVPGFVLDRRLHWVGFLVLNLVLIAAVTIAQHGITPFVDFVNNFFNLNAPRSLSYHDSSFDSLFGITLAFFKVDFSIIRILVLLAKLLSAAAVIAVCLRCIRSRTYFQGAENQPERLFNAIPGLFLLMVLGSPLIWEHHGILLSVPFLLLIKRLNSPAEWIWFAAAYWLEFLLPTFDFYPWSYARVLAPLIVLALIWITARSKQDGSWFRSVNQSPAIRHTQQQ